MISKNHNKILNLIVNQHKYFHNGSFIKIINTINKQLLTKIMSLILNNDVKIYRIIEDNIFQKGKKILLSGFKNDTNILEEKIIHQLNISNTIKTNDDQDAKRKKNNYNFFICSRTQYIFANTLEREWSRKGMTIGSAMVAILYVSDTQFVNGIITLSKRK